MLFVPSQRAPPLKIELPVAAMCQVAVGLQPQPLDRRIRRHVGVLFRADEPLMRAGTAGDVAEKAGRVLALEAAQPGRAHVIIPRACIQKLRARRVCVYRACGRRPVGEHKLLLGFRMQNIGLPVQMIQKRVGEESAVVED